MGDFLKSSRRHLSGGCFLFWAGVLLILPNCGFDGSGGPLPPGPPPHTSAIFCDIAAAPGRHCASPEEQAMGMRLASAAVALVAGPSGTHIGLDDSLAALVRCGGAPEAIVFKGPFPQGLPVCVNCGETIPDPFADATAACQAKCHSFFGTMTADGTIVPDDPPTADTIAFCQANARASTNFPLDGCFDGVCTPGGTLSDDFEDPRRIPESVVWQDLIGVAAAGGTLTRDAANTGTWDAGAASSQVITGGDGYVEFTVTETNRTRVGGLSSGAPPDTDPHFINIGYGLFLSNTGEIFVVENGPAISSFGAYNAGDKFRVKVRDNQDGTPTVSGTATISYAQITGSCMDGMPCNETVFYTSTVAGAYPFRVDASFLEQGGTLSDVRLVRIHP